jgi:hypothetical protein
LRSSTSIEDLGFSIEDLGFSIEDLGFSIEVRPASAGVSI